MELRALISANTIRHPGDLWTPSSPFQAGAAFGHLASSGLLAQLHGKHLALQDAGAVRRSRGPWPPSSPVLGGGCALATWPARVSEQAQSAGIHTSSESARSAQFSVRRSMESPSRARNDLEVQDAASRNSAKDSHRTTCTSHGNFVSPLTSQSVNRSIDSCHPCAGECTVLTLNRGCARRETRRVRHQAESRWGASSRRASLAGWLARTSASNHLAHHGGWRSRAPPHGTPSPALFWASGERDFSSTHLGARLGSSGSESGATCGSLRRGFLKLSHPLSPQVHFIEFPLRP